MYMYVHVHMYTSSPLCCRNTYPEIALSKPELYPNGYVIVEYNPIANKNL